MSHPMVSMGQCYVELQHNDFKILHGMSDMHLSRALIHE